MATFENIQTLKAHDPIEAGSILPPDTSSAAAHPLDTAPYRQKLRKLQDWWFQSRQALADSRYEMAVDEDFYDSLQWRSEDVLELEDRGQLANVFNLIKPTIDWIIGTEKRTRVDFKVYPREEPDVKPAELKTKLLKYVSDVNKTGFHRSRAFADCVKVGIGWIEDGIRSDETEEPLYSRYESWRVMWYDHLAQERDLSDARYIFRSKWVDLDIAEAMFPDRVNCLRAAARVQNVFYEQQDEYFWNVDYSYRANETATTPYPVYMDDAFNVDNRRDRVKLVECWYRNPENVKVIRGNKAMDGLIYDPNNAFMNKALVNGYGSVIDAIKLRVNCAIFVTDFLLQDVPSPYRHNRFPFTPIWCFRRGKDGSPYGFIRPLRDSQEDYNKRRSKSLYIMSTNKMIADSDAFDDWDEAIEEKDRPDGVLRKKKGSQVEIKNETAMGEEHIKIMAMDRQLIQEISGVTDELLGRQTNAVSSLAIRARQDQGTIQTAEAFDNYRFSIQLQGENQLSLIEQYYSAEKQIRITDDPDTVNFLTFNKRTDQGIENDIISSQADFIVDSQDFRENLRIAMFESLMGVLQKLPPEVILQVLDLVIELSDIHNKDEFVARLRKINGQEDPKHANDPEVIAKKQQEAQAQAQEQEKQKQLQERGIMAKIAESEAKVKKLIAETERTNTDKLMKAIQVAIQTAINPHAARGADSIADSAKVAQG